MAEENCIFCKIVAGQVPCDKVYEDSEYLVFLDIRPRAPGHSLVIPKKHVRWVWDAPDLGGYMQVAKRVALAQRTVFGTEMIFGHVMGDEVPHAHIWLVPEHGSQLEDAPRGEIARKIGEQLQK